MKVLAVSDRVEESLLKEHVLKERCRDVQLVLACGDLPPYYLELLVSNLNVPLLHVPGNHDEEYPAFSQGQKSFARGCRNVDEDTVFLYGWIIGGLGGAFRYRDGKYLYDERQMSRKISAIGRRLARNKSAHNRYIDILITHAPPHGIHDGKDLAHRGFKEFLSFMKRYQSTYLIHGHTAPDKDEQVFMRRYHLTSAINANLYQVLELERETLQ